MKSLNTVKPDLRKRCHNAQKGAQTGPNNAMLWIVFGQFKQGFSYANPPPPPPEKKEIVPSQIKNETQNTSPDVNFIRTRVAHSRETCLSRECATRGDGSRLKFRLTERLPVFCEIPIFLTKSVRMNQKFGKPKIELQCLNGEEKLHQVRNFSGISRVRVFLNRHLKKYRIWN